MQPSGYDDKTNFDQIDFNGIAAFMFNCGRFPATVESSSDQARASTNKIRHMPDMCSSALTDQDTTECIDNLSMLLNDPTFSTDEKVQEALKQLDELKTTLPTLLDEHWEYIIKDIATKYLQEIHDLCKDEKESLQTEADVKRADLQSLGDSILFHLQTRGETVLGDIKKSIEVSQEAITNSIKDAMKRIEENIEKGEVKIEEETEKGKRKIDERTVRGEGNIKEKTEIGEQQIEEKTKIGERKIEEKTNIGERKIGEKTDIGERKFKEKTNIGERKIEEKTNIGERKIEEKTEIGEQKVQEKTEIGDHKIEEKTEIGEQQIEEKMKMGEHKIEEKTEIGEHKIEEKTEKGEQKIEKKTELGERKIEEKTEIGERKIDAKLRKLDEKSGKLTKADLRKELFKLYKKTASTVRIRLDIDEAVEKVYEEPKLTLKELGKDKEDDLSELNDVFRNKKGTMDKMIFVEGEPGSGKSSLCKMIVHDWCETKHDERTETEGHELLSQFEFVFYIILREAKNECHVKKMIFKNIIDRIGLDKASTEELLGEVLKSNTCLLLLDGLDEWQHPEGCNLDERIPHVETRWENSTILITTRPYKIAELKIGRSQIGKHIMLKGVSNPNKTD